MHIVQNRRSFVATIGAAIGGSWIGLPNSFAQNQLETTTVRFAHSPAVCLAPQYIAEELLRADGFTDVRHIDVDAGIAAATMMAHGELDFTFDFASGFITPIDAGEAIKILAGLHVGCYELFAQPSIKSVAELKGKRIGVGSNLKSDPYVFVSAMATYVGIDPQKDITWVTSKESPMQLFIDGKVDAFLGFSVECQELRARNIGHVIVNGGQDSPWSQYFCCVLAANSSYIARNPIATKRVLGAVLAAADICQKDPERALRKLLERGYKIRPDYALGALKDIQYSKWREYDPEDTVRFISLRLHEAGMITSTPQTIISRGTDWRFLNDLKREL